MLGKIGGFLALLGIIAAPITSGDTAFRSTLLILADIFKCTIICNSVCFNTNGFWHHMALFRLKQPSLGYSGIVDDYRLFELYCYVLLDYSGASYVYDNGMRYLYINRS